MADLIERSKLRKDFCNMCEAMQPEMIDCDKKSCMSMQIIDEQPAVNRWISCEDELPVEEKEVLVYVKGNFDNSIPFITTAYLNSDNDWNSDYDGEVIDSKITHWMPLPEPPEKE